METLIRLTLPLDRNRRPDVAFVSAETLAEASAQPGSDNALAILPELMAEVVSPSDLVEELHNKLSASRVPSTPDIREYPSVRKTLGVPAL